MADQCPGCEIKCDCPAEVRDEMKLWKADAENLRNMLHEGLHCSDCGNLKCVKELDDGGNNPFMTPARARCFIQKGGKK